MDPLIKSQLLYQLSYTPTPVSEAIGPGGEARNILEKIGLASVVSTAMQDISQAVDFPYLEGFAAGDFVVIDAVLGLFCEQAQIWIALLETDGDQWIDAVHTIKGAARGIGAFQLGDACERAEAIGPAGLADVRRALDATLVEVEAYRRELAARS